jgi:hypothetical protein
LDTVREDAVWQRDTEGDMSEFLQNYSFFILIAILMVVCHTAHGRHGRRDRQPSTRQPGGEDHHQ